MSDDNLVASLAPPGTTPPRVSSEEPASTTVSEKEPDQPTKESTATEQPSGSAASPQDDPPSEEHFMGKDFDPETLKGTPLEEVHKNLLRGFHSKTQELAKQKRNFQQFQRDAESFRALMGNEQVRQAVMSALSGVQQPQAPPQEDLSKVDISSLSEEELIAYQQKLVEQQIEAKLNERLQAQQPIQNAILRNAVAQTLGAVDANLSNKYEDFGEYRDQIKMELQQVNSTSGNPFYVDLFLMGTNQDGTSHLEANVEALYKRLAFDGLQNRIQSEAMKKLQEKKAANLPQGGNSAQTKPLKDTSGKSPQEIAFQNFQKKKTELGL